MTQNETQFDDAKVDAYLKKLQDVSNEHVPEYIRAIIIANYPSVIDQIEAAKEAVVLFAPREELLELERLSKEVLGADRWEEEVQKEMQRETESLSVLNCQTCPTRDVCRVKDRIAAVPMDLN